MGKLEKVVVLSVLFVIAVILVVSLTMDNPIDKQNVSVLGQPGPKPQTQPTPVAPVDAQLAAQPANVPATTPANGAAIGGANPAPTTLLSTNVNTPTNAPAPNVTPTAALLSQPAPSLPVPGAIPAGSLLRTSDGLQDSFVNDMKFYTWKPGDTYRGIAQTYYGDWEKLTILRRANEGRRNVQPGEKILVPVFDPDAPAGGASGATIANAANAPKGAAATPANAPATKKDASKKTGKSATSDKAVAGGGRTHVVKEGESLWKIAKAELGNGALWEKIYAANKDVMKSPEALKTGMKLKIP